MGQGGEIGRRLSSISSFTISLMKTKKIIVIITLFVITLTALRLLWLEVFTQQQQLYADKGQLDVRDFHFQDSTLTLDGEWLFYPSQWLMEQEQQSNQSTYLHVPGGWDKVVQEERNPYGYGSYRLHILVNPEETTTYSIRVPSIRSASEVYVNGRLLAKSGKLGENRTETVAENVPFTASFDVQGQSEIEIVIQVANFQDPRMGGIVRSIKFGHEDVIYRETLLSITMQLLVAVVLLIHAGYAIILYLVGSKDKRLLYFSLLMVSTMFYYLLSNDDKLLTFWFSINYEWSFILVHLTAIGIAYPMLQCIEQWLPPHFKPYKYGFAIICVVASLLAILLPTHYLVTIQIVYILIFGVSIMITIIIVLRNSVKDIRNNIFVLLAIIAFVNSMVWAGILMIIGSKVIFYPFDLIITIACLAIVWFQGFAKVHADTKAFALQLQKADKQKDEFLASTSHELRNPLHSIINISRAVLDREVHALSDTSVNDLEAVLAVGKRMSLLLDDLLDVMSLQENTQKLQLGNVSIHTVVSSVLEMLRYTVEGKPVQFIHRIPADFQQVWADENRVAQIVLNLVHNAVKFTNEGYISILGYTTKGGMAKIIVEDTGIGMDQETIQRIFRPYEQGAAGKNIVEGGFGLGLSVSKQLIELQGGTLEVQSVLGKGSTFTFTLPLSKDVQDDMVTESNYYHQEDMQIKPSTEATSVEDGNRPRILVVDDEPINLRVVETILTNDKYDIATVTSGIKALECIQSQKWDLVISDVMMPKMSGYELVRIIRKQFSLTELPVLLLTARSQPHQIEKGFLVGANDYVVKPVDALELRSRVEALARVKRSIQERHRMEAAWLQAQIEPHFLFNTLNAILTLSEAESARTSKLVEALSDFLRESYNFQNVEALVPLENELRLIRAYLYIQQERFGDRIQVVWEVEAEEDVLIPPLIMQPLVENALKHGILKRTEGGTIYIRIMDNEDHLEIIVADDGVGMNDRQVAQLLQRTAHSSKSIGLLNTHLRLQQHYGQGLQILSSPNQGTTISFIVLAKKAVY
ncbi:ATP-binding protein [Lysinibacillus sp. FSL H8-0500]|uniref:hybrid sensor histidine kinase/response regulator n=1 Tax=Lysinibacillus sp. FSL H8-0500 TaxID=2921393 RepID=UPI003101AB8A